MTSIRTAALACAAALAVSPALAQGYGATGNTQSTPMQTSPGTSNTQGMQRVHEMPATVTGVNKSTGMVDVKSEGMKLRLHFPPSALTNIKTGDKIKVQLGLMKT